MKIDFTLGKLSGYPSHSLKERLTHHCQGMAFQDNHVFFSRNSAKGAEVLIFDRERRTYTGRIKTEEEHIGGIDTSKNFLVAPLYSGNRGRIQIWDKNQGWDEGEGDNFNYSFPINAKPYACGIGKWANNTKFLIGVVTRADGTKILFYEWKPGNDAVYVGYNNFMLDSGARNNIKMDDDGNLFTSRAHLGKGVLTRYQIIPSNFDQVCDDMIVRLRKTGKYTHRFLYCSSRFGATYDNGMWWRTARNFVKGKLTVRVDTVHWRKYDV